MRFFKRLYYQYLLKRYAIKHHLWEDSTKNIALLRGLDTIEKTRLRELSSIFLHQKEFTGIGIKLTQKMQIVVAVTVHEATTPESTFCSGIGNLNVIWPCVIPWVQIVLKV